ncbi:glycosyltransferase family 2 protein [Pedobacter jejuensis]|uniref:glycosyltransferase family 2 protein n=1 Tax=Pedobacter jejuensis TaxID=1268550 RepID=UPI00142E3C9E|nr:glycosyltransferase [Pedobacter jejuensis]
MQQNSKPLISIIIPAYNAEQTIIQTLDSVYNSTYTEFEVIVINDGSTDDTLLLLEQYPKPIKIYSTENKGVSNARNLGFEKSIGDYIQYLDADDLLLPDKLNVQVKALKENNAGVAYGDWQKFEIEKNETFITETITRKIEGDLEIAIFTDFWCPPAAILYSRDVCKKLRWNETLPIIQDARYFLDAAMMKNTFVYTPGVMALYRTAQYNSLSKKNDFLFLSDIYENTKDLYQIWKGDFAQKPEKRIAIIKSLRHCINRLSIVNKNLASEAIELLLSIDPTYIPKEKGLLRSFSKIIGYKNAENLAAWKRKYKG